MQPTRVIFDRITALMFAYINPLLDDPGWEIKLIKGPFSPGPNLVYADLDIDADWAAAPLVFDASVIGWNPINGARTLILFKGGSGANSCYVVSSGTPRTVFGLAIVETGGTFVYASGLFEAPVSIDQATNYIYMPKMSFEFPRDMFVVA